MSRYVDPTEQLVTELVVADVRRSAAFYRDLGFQRLRVEVSVYQGLGELPAFNPDLEDDTFPVVATRRRCLGAADGVAICSACVLGQASPIVPIGGKNLDANGLASHPEFGPLLR